MRPKWDRVCTVVCIAPLMEFTDSVLWHEPDACDSVFACLALPKCSRPKSKHDRNPYQGLAFRCLYCPDRFLFDAPANRTIPCFACSICCRIRFTSVPSLFNIQDLIYYLELLPCRFMLLTSTASLRLRCCTESIRS